MRRSGTARSRHRSPHLGAELSGLLCAVLMIPMLFPCAASAQGKTPLVIFDEDDATGTSYYDASFGTRQGLSALTLAGGGDKLPIHFLNAVSGSHSGLLQWTSGPGGTWQLFVASPGWATRDASGYDSLVLHFNGPAVIDTASLPRVGLESSTNQKSSPVSLAAYLPQGIDADTATWQRISIPLAAFQPYGPFLLSQFKDFWFGQRNADNTQHTVWFDNVRLVGPVGPVVTDRVRGLVARSGDRSVILHWDPDSTQMPDAYNVYRSLERTGPYALVAGTPMVGDADLNVQNGIVYWYYVRPVGGAAEGPSSDTVSATPMAFADDNAFLDYVQRAAIDYFWYEANPRNGLVRDRSQRGSPASIAAMGFGLSAICVGVDHGWIPLPAARERVAATLRTLWEQPQGTAPSGMIGYRGFFYHWLDMASATRMTSWNSELSSIDTGLLLAGLLHARQFFTGPEAGEAEIRMLVDSISRRVDWEWMRNGGASLTHGWQPATGFIPYRWIGYNEAMILYLLAIGAPAVPGSAWDAWVSGYSWQTHYGQSFVNFPPLFGHQYSHCWVDFRSIADSYMRGKGITYAENTRRATLAQQAYCIANPGGFSGYGAYTWGLTACDGPTGGSYLGYSARGAPPGTNDDGTIAPTAAAGSLPFAPEVCLPTLRAMYDQYRNTVWTPYGFCDAFNLKANWWDPDVIGIDQGPIALMIENYRTGSVWTRMQAAPEIQRGLAGAGFTTVVAVSDDPGSVPLQFSLEQNFPNPFNPTTVVSCQWPVASTVNLVVYDLLGREVTILANGRYGAGRHMFTFDAGERASGVYVVRLEAAGQVATRRMILLR